MVTITGRHTPWAWLKPINEIFTGFFIFSPEGEHLDEGRVEMVDTNDYYQ